MKTTSFAQFKKEFVFALKHEATAIQTIWTDLSNRAAELKEVDPSYVTPWEEIAPPADDQRLYQIPNCKAAILKVLPTKANQALTPNQIVAAVHALKLSYATCTIIQTISKLKQEYFVDEDGYVLTFTPISNFRFLFYKVKE